MSVIAAQGPRGHVALIVLEDVLCAATEKRKARMRERVRVGGKGMLPGRVIFFLQNISSITAVLPSSLLP